MVFTPRILSFSIKKQLIGSWVYERNETELSEHLKLYDELPEFAERKLNRIAQRNLGKGLKLKFTKENKLIAENEKEGQIEFRYLVDSEGIKISRSDYVISIDYELIDKRKLLITKEYQTNNQSQNLE